MLTQPLGIIWTLRLGLGKGSQAHLSDPRPKWACLACPLWTWGPGRSYKTQDSQPTAICGPGQYQHSTLLFLNTNDHVNVLKTTGEAGGHGGLLEVEGPPP